MMKGAGGNAGIGGNLAIKLKEFLMTRIGLIYLGNQALRILDQRFSDN